MMALEGLLSCVFGDRELAMGKFCSSKVAGLVFAALLLSCFALVPFASALTLDNVRTWYWTNHTFIGSVVRGDVDGDGKVEIVTGGYYNDGARNNAQLCVRDGAALP